MNAFLAKARPQAKSGWLELEKGAKFGGKFGKWTKQLQICVQICLQFQIVAICCKQLQSVANSFEQFQLN